MTLQWEAGETQAPLPPTAKGLPILGSVLPLTQDPLKFLVDQYRELGPVFRVTALNRNFVVLAGPEVNRFMSQIGDQYLTGKDSWTTFAAETNSEYFLAAIDGEPHSRLRKILKKPYSRQTMLTYIPKTVKITDHFTSNWQEGHTFIVFPEMQRLIAEQIGTLLLGRGPGEYFGDFVVFMRTLLNAVLGQRPKFVLKLAGYREAKARVEELAAKMVEAHRAAPSLAEDADLVDYLLEAQKTDGDIVTESELLLGVLGPYLAGIDTAAGTTSFILYGLLKHPEVIERIQPEIDHAFADGSLDATKLREMEILHATVLEAMRLYPVAPMLPRTVLESFTIGGYQLLKGQPVMMANGVAHFDETLYKDPEKFDIDRVLAPRQEHKQAGAYAPYGLGSHTCAGAGFADVEIMVTVATLLHRFEFAMEPENYTLKRTFNPSPAPSKEFRIRITRRRHG